MSIHSVFSICLIFTLAISTIGCGGEQLSVVQPNEEFLQQLQSAEDLEKSGATTMKQ